jgi:hypothetical protein
MLRRAISSIECVRQERPPTHRRRGRAEAPGPVLPIKARLPGMKQSDEVSSDDYGVSFEPVRPRVRLRPDDQTTRRPDGPAWFRPRLEKGREKPLDRRRAYSRPPREYPI